MNKVHLPVAALCAVMLIPSSRSFAQGDLTPPGTPAPTMKTLDQLDAKLEPRLAINATNTPGDADYEAIISAPGSYYLTGNLDVAKTNGIHVTVAGVTLDLMGFQISRASGTGGGGILIGNGADHCVVQNGSIDGFSTGADGQTGSTLSPRGGAFLRLSVSHCSFLGLRGGNGWRFEGCRAHDNTGAAGLQASLGCTLMNCSADHNTGNAISTAGGCTLTNCSAVETSGVNGRGFLLGQGNTLTNCSAYFNASVGFDFISAASFFAAGSVATNCAANNNGDSGFYCSYTTVTGCVAYHNSVSGIVSSVGCVVSNNTSSGNVGDGFTFGSNNVITGNNAYQNGGNGFRSYGSLNRIDGNTATANSGIGFLWANDYLVRNVSFVNTLGNYSPTPGTINTNSGPIQSASAATNAWANF